MDIGVARKLEVGQLNEAFALLLPGLCVVATPEDALLEVHPDVSVRLFSSPSEFPCALGVGARMLAPFDFEDFLRDLGEQLSVFFRTRVIVGDTRVGPTPVPYWSLVWDHGVPFLADDMNTLWGDGEGGPVKIVEQLALVPHQRPPLSARVDVKRGRGAGTSDRG